MFLQRPMHLLRQCNRTAEVAFVALCVSTASLPLGHAHFPGSPPSLSHSSVPHLDLARLIDALPRLRMVALRDNPCMVPYSVCRASVLGKAGRVMQPDDCFVVLDNEITPADRLTALRDSKAPQVARPHLLVVLLSSALLFLSLLALLL